MEPAYGNTVTGPTIREHVKIERTATKLVWSVTVEVVYQPFESMGPIARMEARDRRQQLVADVLEEIATIEAGS